jgi:nicotinate-nucleotide pyrophosphorylase (carboxylating)
MQEIVCFALQEDLGRKGDVTSQATIPKKSNSVAYILSKEEGIFCGAKIISDVFRQLDPKIIVHLLAQDGDPLYPGQVVAEIEGNTRALLAGERTVLNFVQRLSGIATLTHQFLQASRVSNRKSKVKILDTRKTTPLLRVLEKYAVLCGGGTNHRFGLHDMVLIKDNHLAALAGISPDPVVDAIKLARKKWPRLKIEVECETLEQVKEAIRAKADMILLDNMTPPQLRKAVKIVKGRAKTEASGGVNLKTISSIAKTGVDFVSIGALTHSARSLDFSMEINT